MTITVSKLLEDSLLGLTVTAGEAGLGRTITTAELNRPSQELHGFFQAFRSDRIQVFGNGEVIFINKYQDNPAVFEHIDKIFDRDVPCVIVTNAKSPPRIVEELGNQRGIPVMTCPHSTTKLYKRLWENLDSEFAPETTMHGTLMDIHDMGVLLQGKSSVGKSECALELIRRGFHLVADDMVTIKCINDTILLGRGSTLVPYHMEARGLGIIDISRMFGVRSIRKRKRITMVITLADWNEVVEYDRTGLIEEGITILDVEIPHITIPVRPGRNVGTLVEIAALNQKLKSLGIHTARLMDEKLINEMQRRSQEKRQV